MVVHQSATLVAADCLRPPKDQYRLLQTAVRQSPTDKRLPAPFLRPTGRREVFGACSKHLSTTSWSQRRRRNPQKTLVIVSDHRTVVADHQKTAEDHQLFDGRNWSLVVGRPCVNGVLCLFARSEYRPSTKERHRFLSVAIFSISFLVYPISFVSFSVSLCQVFRGLPLLVFP